MNIDYSIFHWMNSFVGKSVFFDALAVFFAEYLGYLLVIFVFIIFWKKLKIVSQALLAAGFARLGIAELIRFLLPRPRPFVNNSIYPLLDHDSSSSFPSGHASFFFALSYIVYRYNKKAGIIFFFSSCLISVFRVYCGIHWPSDIILGAFVGIFSGWAVLFVWDFFQRKLIKIRKKK